MSGNTTVENSVLAQDIKDIIERDRSNGYEGVFSFETKLHTVDKDLIYSDGLALNSIKILRDYKNSMADYIEIELSILIGTYMYDVYDYLNNIEVTIISRRQKFKGKIPVYRTDRYKAVYLPDKNTLHPTKLTAKKEDLNQQMPLVLTLQLLDRSAEVVRIKTTQGSYDKNINKGNKDMKIKSFLKSVISEELDKILIENKQAIDSICIEEPDNTEELKAIVLPSGTRVVEIADIIQNKNIGIYTGGIGAYVQNFCTDHYTTKKTYFIYSLYKTEKYHKADKKLMLYAPIASSHSNTDITYKYEDDIMRVLTHPVPKILEDKETKMMSEGSGFRTADANSFMKKPVEVKDGKVLFKPSNVNTEVVNSDRADNLNYAPNRGVSNNNFVLASEISERDGNYLMVDTTNIDPDFIQPGAACKIAYTNKTGDVEDIYGVVNGAIIRFVTQSSGLLANFSIRSVNLSCNAVLQIFVKTKREDKQNV